MSRDRAGDGDFNIAAILMYLIDSEEALSERIKVYERRLDNAETEIRQERQERLNHLSDAQIKVLLECQKRDEHDGVPRTHIDDLRDLGAFEPDYCFLLQQHVNEEEQGLAHREAIIALLDSDIPLSPPTRRFLKRELMSKWWPDQKREQKREHSRIMTELMRADFELTKAKMPLAEAKAEVAKRWGRNSAEALRKALQPNRLNRRPRRRARG